jgi:hypothetical protein
MTTEFIQPTHPIRIVTTGTDSIFTHPVFAIAISNDHHVEYLTVNGMFYNSGSILFAEQCVNGEWTRMTYLNKHRPTPPEV